MAGLIYNALEMAVLRYNANKGTSHLLSDFTFSPPIDLRGREVNHPSGKNTLVQARLGETPVTFVYDRVGIKEHYLQYIAVFYDTRIENDVVDIKSWMKGFSKQHGIPITGDEVVNAPLPWATLLTTVDVNVPVTINESSYNYLPGSVFNILVDGKYIRRGDKTYRIYDSTLEPETYYEDYVYQSANLATFHLTGHLTAPVDYTPARHHLCRLSGFEEYRAGDLLGASTNAEFTKFMAAFAQALSECDGNPWTYSKTLTNLKFNLGTAWVVYNGPTKYADRGRAQSYRQPTQYLHLLKMADQSYDNVAILYLTSVSGMTRTAAVFHYNSLKGVE